MHLNVWMTWIKRIVVGLVVIITIYGLSVIIDTELLQHHERALVFLDRIDSIKQWFILLRVVLYTGVIVLCGWFMKLLRPTISANNIKTTRTLLIRLFVIYELFFGINIIAFLSH